VTAQTDTIKPPVTAPSPYANYRMGVACELFPNENEGGSSFFYTAPSQVTSVFAACPI
jgi:hypothetical protein